MFPLSDLAAYVPLIIWLHVLAAMAAVISEERSEKNDDQSPKVTRQQIKANGSKCTSHEIEPDDSDMLPVNLELIDPERSQDESNHCEFNENVVLTPDEYVFKTLSSSGIRGCKDAWPIPNPPLPWFVYARTRVEACEGMTLFGYRADLYVDDTSYYKRTKATEAFRCAIDEIAMYACYCDVEFLYDEKVWHYTYRFTYAQKSLIADEDAVLNPDEYVLQTLSSSGIMSSEEARRLDIKAPYTCFVCERTGEYATKGAVRCRYRADLYIRQKSVGDWLQARDAFEHAVESISTFYQRSVEFDEWHYIYEFTYVQKTPPTSKRRYMKRRVFMQMTNIT